MARKQPHTEGTSHRLNGEMGLQRPDTQRWLTLECYGTEHVFSILCCELSPLWQKGVSLNVGTCMVLHDHKKRRENEICSGRKYQVWMGLEQRAKKCTQRARDQYGNLGAWTRPRIEQKKRQNTLMFEDQKWQGGRGRRGVERKKGGVRAKSSGSSSLTAGFNQSED